MGEPIEQSVFWDQRADAWAQHADAMEQFARFFGDPAMDLLGTAPGQHVVDVGCGPGVTTLELARRVGPAGSATGVDVSDRMVEAARTRAAAAGVPNARFDVRDAGTGPLGSFDAGYSRFGVMFFDQPATAFANLARSIRPGGRFAAAMWAELDANPWMFVPTLFAAEPLHAELDLPGPGEPGPFSLADPQRTAALLESCGFRDVEVVRREHAWTFDTATAADSIGQMLSVGPLGEAWAAAGQDVRSAAVAAVRDGCDDYRHGSSRRLPAAALIVSATASG